MVGFGLQFKLSPTECKIGSIFSPEVVYSSTDGQTYTRTDANGNPIGITMNVFDSDYNRYSDVLTKFLHPIVLSFLGLYEWRVNKWQYASTQLSDIASSNLLPNNIAYGSSGIAIGDGSIYNNLPVKDFLSMLYGKNNIESNTYISLANIDTKIPASIPEEDIHIQFLKSKSLENNDKLILQPRTTATTTEFSTYDEKYIIDNDVTALVITNLETGDKITATPNEGFRINYCALHGHIVYCLSLDATLSSVTWSVRFAKYDIDTNTWSYSKLYNTTGATQSYAVSFQIFPKLDMIVFSGRFNKYNNVGPKKLVLVDKMSEFGDNFLIQLEYNDTELTNVKNILAAELSTGNLLISRNNSNFGIYDINGSEISNFTISDEYDFVSGYGIRAHAFYHQSENTIHVGKNNVDITTGTVIATDEIHPIKQSNDYDVTSANSDTNLYIFGDDYSLQKTYSISRKLYKQDTISSPYIACLQITNNELLLTDGYRNVSGIPYTIGDVLNYDYIATPCIGSSIGTTLEKLYVVTSKANVSYDGTISPTEYNTALNTAEQILGE